MHNRNKPGRLTYDNISGCWVWSASLRPTRDGRRGRVYVHATGHRTWRRVDAHVFFYEAFKGPIPSGLEIDHLCRNVQCVNPDHLEAVTHQVNMRRGKNTKLTEDIAADIRRRYAGGERQKDIAASVGVHPAHVSRIVSGSYWKEVNRT